MGESDAAESDPYEANMDREAAPSSGCILAALAMQKKRAGGRWPRLLFLQKMVVCRTGVALCSAQMFLRTTGCEWRGGWNGSDELQLSFRVKRDPSNRGKTGNAGKTEVVDRRASAAHVSPSCPVWANNSTQKKGLMLL